MKSDAMDPRIRSESIANALESSNMVKSEAVKGEALKKEQAFTGTIWDTPCEEEDGGEDYK